MRNHRSSIRRHAVKTAMAFVIFMTADSFSPSLSPAAESIEELAGRGELLGNVEKLILDLEELKKHRIFLNTAGADEFRQLPWLGSADIRALLRERKKAAITSLGRLASIIGKGKAEAVAPYIAFDAVRRSRKKRTDGDFSGTFTSRVFREIPLRRGVIDGKYAAAAEKLSNRLKLSFSRYTLTVVQERDIGEPELFDFTSMSLGASGIGILGTAAVGNYEVNLGEGLVIGQGRYYAGGADVPSSVRLSSKRLSPYSSSSEYGFFQGAAATFVLAPCELTVFSSANRVDAVINRKTGMITSFDDSGYHRTATERERKDRVTERVYGANLRYAFKSGIAEGKIGGSWVRYDYGVPMTMLGGSSSSTLAGIEGEALIGGIGLFGEAAWAERPADSFSWTAGAEYEPVRGVNLLLAVRSYGSNYYSPFASAFAERGEHGGNEQGIHAGAGFRLSDRLSVSGYYDRFRFPLLDDHCPFASDGHDARIYLAWKPGGGL
ncbi:MAG: helix-hairpin-helix domain-containing protein, partial [Chlorobiaceae bacterium]|nr:helix-hairpin-helix domain-containing protein [Chlorobiaceae bacterium]